MSDNQEVVQENKPSDKELNFRALENKYRAQLEQERQARLELERSMQELQSRKQNQVDDDDDSEPYVDHKRLNKKLDSFEKKMEEKIERKAEERARLLLEKERQDSWLRNNSDFYDVMQHAEKLVQKDPELAEAILQMPDNFERQKLVYKNIKAFELHKPPAPQSTIQDKVDLNRRSPYYQPSGVANAPYSSQGDFSASGQKNAYMKMKELQSKLRI